MADSINDAITMPLAEQKMRNTEMQKRLKRYTVDYWAKEFMTSLGRVTEEKEHGFVSEFTGSTLIKVSHEFQCKK